MSCTRNHSSQFDSFPVKKIAHARALAVRYGFLIPMDGKYYISPACQEKAKQGVESKEYSDKLDHAENFEYQDLMISMTLRELKPDIDESELCLLVTWMATHRRLLK